MHAIRSTFNRFYAGLCRLLQFLIGVQDGDHYWDADTAYRLVAISPTAKLRIEAIEACVLRGVPLEYCLTLGRIAPRLEGDDEQAAFVEWMESVQEQLMQSFAVVTPEQTPLPTASANIL